MNKDHNSRNRESRERLAQVVRSLGARNVPLADGWTASALVAHLAFWDRFALARLQKFMRDGETPAVASDVLRDFMNAGAMRQWLDTPPAVAAQQANEAAAEFDRFVEALPAERLAALVSFGRPLLYERSGHRDQHLDDIERALA